MPKLDARTERKIKNRMLCVEGNAEKPTATIEKSENFKPNTAKAIDPGHAASTWASGNQKENGNTGDLTANRMKRHQIKKDCTCVTKDIRARSEKTIATDTAEAKIIEKNAKNLRTERPSRTKVDIVEITESSYSRNAVT